jgi:heme/copper-type cytochrome/quinol oxidase subunit 2
LFFINRLNKTLKNQINMKSWQFWVIILVFIFVVVPLIYFAVVARNVAKVVEQPQIKLQSDGPIPLSGGICTMGPDGKVHCTG